MIITGKKFSKPEMSRVKNGDVIFLDKDKKENRTRLDLYLAEILPEYNRSTLQNFIKSGYVSVDGKRITKPNYSILLSYEKDGEMVSCLPDVVCDIPKRDVPPDIRKLIIYEDDNVLVINKPAGLLSMAKGEYTKEATLEDYGLLVHRLDRDTSGVVILAKNEATQSMLRKQFQERKAHKTYYAIVLGKPKLDHAMIDLPIERNYKHPTTFQVSPTGKPSQTEYNVIWSGSSRGLELSLLELKPITGRTHQLRVHLRFLGCPILGDKVYGEPDKNKWVSRLLLHAKTLEITIPGAETGVRKTFEAPIPSDFYDIIPDIKE
ncbi:RluA family pseudouridine synthase [Candidatus Saccharibacteria bacterium]|nr:RluA family pseudouridine synthase [Candidatus Saccharibacteria bacterium]